MTQQLMSHSNGTFFVKSSFSSTSCQKVPIKDCHFRFCIRTVRIIISAAFSSFLILISFINPLHTLSSIDLACNSFILIIFHTYLNSSHHKPFTSHSFTMRFFGTNFFYNLLQNQQNEESVVQEYIAKQQPQQKQQQQEECSSPLSKINQLGSFFEQCYCLFDSQNQQSVGDCDGDDDGIDLDNSDIWGITDQDIDMFLFDDCSTVACYNERFHAHLHENEQPQ